MQQKLGWYGKIAKNLQTMSELIDCGNTNAAKNGSEKQRKLFRGNKFEKTSYEIIS